MTYSITCKEQGSEISFVGHISLDELQEANEKLHIDERTYYNHTYSIWNFENASLKSIQNREFFLKIIAPDLGLASTCEQFKIAMVINDKNDPNNLCKQYKEYISSRTQWQIELFESYHHGLTWCLS